jgi:hypothetical protein
MASEHENTLRLIVALLPLVSGVESCGSDQSARARNPETTDSAAAGASGHAGIDSGRAGNGGIPSSDSSAGDANDTTKDAAEDPGQGDEPRRARPGELCSGTPSIDPSRASQGSCELGAKCIVPTCDVRGACQSEARGQCVCGVVLDNRCSPGARCLCAACSENVGICANEEERRVLCGSNAAAIFRCDNSSG